MIPPALAELLADGRRITWPEYLEIALYDPVSGFYATGGRAGGRSGDFLTSPEVGPLFGAVLAGMLDEVWERLGRPDPFVVADVGAGPGTLARSVRVAEPACAAALVYLLVERSAAQRALHADHLPGWVGERSGAELDAVATTPLAGAGPVFASADELPAELTGVVVANELLDNLPFDVVVRTDGGAEHELLALDDGGELESIPVPAPAEAVSDLGAVGATPGMLVPWQPEARRWLGDVLSGLRRGRVVVLDYGATTPEMGRRPYAGWLRTFRGNQAGGHPLDAPGSQDITADVAIDQLQLDHPATRVRTQAEWLVSLGIDELVEEGRRTWTERAHAPDIQALRARSRVREAEALTDRDGLGAFVVLEWDVGLSALTATVGSGDRRH
jgi:SAM-dependent MidA family methyltransferase